MVVKVDDLMLFYAESLRLGEPCRLSSQPYGHSEEVVVSLGLLENESFPYYVRPEAVLIPKSLVELKSLIPKSHLTTLKENKNGGRHLR